MYHFFILSFAVAVLVFPRLTLAAGPEVKINNDADTVTITNGSTVKTIDYDDATRDIQAVRISSNNQYYVLVLRFRGDGIRLFLYDVNGKLLAKEPVFTALGDRDFTVMRLEPRLSNGKRQYRIRAVRTNAAGQPIKLHIAYFRVAPEDTADKITRVSMREKKFTYPDLNALSDDKGGLRLFNYQRFSAGLLPITRLTKLDNACALHAEYMRVNQEATHVEDEEKAGYTEEGAAAGRASHVSEDWGSSMVGSVHQYTAAIYHRFAMIENDLLNIGYAYSAPADDTIFQYSCLDVNTSSLTENLSEAADNVTIYDSQNHDPIPYPGVNQTAVPIWFAGEETPDPLDAFGAEIPVGYPISLTFSARSTVTDASLELFDPAGNSLPGYFRAPNDLDDPNRYYQKNNVTFMAESQFDYGTTYTVHVTATVDGEPFTKEWSFTTEASPQ